MKTDACLTGCAAAASLSALLVAALLALPLPSQAQTAGGASRPRHAPRPQSLAEIKPKPVPRAVFSAADDAVAVIPGIPDARFWADSPLEFSKALPAKPGPWLAMSSGGADGAFGAGLINGLTASGKRPDFSVVTGVSTGALMAPFVFAGPRYDNALRDAYTKVTAADVFEIGATPESFLDTWPLKDFIGKEITPALLADIASQYRAGRRLFVITTDLDSERPVAWNMGAIAAHGGKQAAELFRAVLLASCSVPGAFPPVLIDVEGNGKRFAEMHVDGGVGSQFFVAPAALMAANASYRLPASELYIIVNSGLHRDFQVVERSTETILGQSVDMAVKVDTRLMLDRAYVVAKRSGVGFHVASIPPSFDAPSHGAFDPKYMRALFQAGYDLGKSPSPFSAEPPPYSEQSAPPPQDPDKTGADK
jgi:hypothetical protein